MFYFPTGDAEAPPSTHVERSTCCAQVRYSPTLQQQNSISPKGLNADFIIQYDVDLRDLMGEVQVRSVCPCLAWQTHTGVHVVTIREYGLWSPPFYFHPLSGV